MRHLLPIGAQRRRPQEHECVHTGLKQRLDCSEQGNLAICIGRPSACCQQFASTLEILEHTGLLPSASFSLTGLRAGVHGNTKVYMLASNSERMTPSRAIFRSAHAGPLLIASDRVTL